MEEVNKELLKNADKELNRSDREIMARALSKNPYHAHNYLTAMTIKLRGTLLSLNDNTIKLKKAIIDFNESSDKHNGTILALSFSILFLALIQVMIQLVKVDFDIINLILIAFFPAIVIIILATNIWRKKP